MIREIVRKSKNKSYFMKLITYMLLIATLPFLLFSIFSYCNSIKALEAQIDDANRRYLKQTMKSVEIIINQIDASCKQMTLDRAFKDFELFPAGLHYEKLEGKYLEEDLPVLDRYLENKSKIIERINVLQLSNTYIHSVNFVDREKGIILTGKGTQYTLDEFFDKEWFKYLDSTAASPMFMNSRTVNNPNGESNTVITVIQRSYNKRDNAFVINLDAEAIYSNILKQFDENNERELAVLDRDGKAILFREYEYPLEVLTGILAGHREQGGQFTSFTGRYNDKNLYLSYALSEALGWEFVSVIRLEYYYSAVNNMRWLLLTVSSALLIGILCVAFVSSHRIYTPILHLLKIIVNRDPNYSKSSLSSGRAGEMKMIETSLEGALSERERLQNKLKESLPAYKEKLIHRMIRGSSTSPEKIRESMDFLGMDLELFNLALMLVVVQYRGASERDLEKKSIDKLQIIETVEARHLCGVKGIVTETEDEKFLVLFNCEEAEFGKVFITAGEIRDTIDHIFHMDCMIGIGRHCRTVREVPRACLEAEEALKCRILTGDYDIVYIDDITVGTIDDMDHIKQKEGLLLDHIRSGDSVSAAAVLEGIEKEITLRSRSMHYRQIQQVYLGILTRLLDTAADIGYSLQHHFMDQTGLYINLTEKKHISDITALLREVTGKLASGIKEQLAQKENRYAAQVVELLRKEYGYTITLNTVAEKLNLNPSYLGRVFKQSRGKTFLDYLTEIRMENSKMLLKETNLKIKEIGEKVGYTNSYYFIRVFKDYTGMTPGEYREGRAK